MGQRDIEAIVAGHLCIDVIPRFAGEAAPPGELFVPGRLIDVEEAAFSTGGAVSNTGIALGRVGVRTTLMARIGRDDFGRMIRERIAQVQEERLRELLLALVRAAEQIFGAQDDVATSDDRTALGNRKLDYVLGQAADQGLPATVEQVEAAVYEVKAKELQGGLVVSGEGPMTLDDGA